VETGVVQLTATMMERSVEKFTSGTFCRAFAVSVALLVFICLISPARADERLRDHAKAFALQWLDSVDHQQYADSRAETALSIQRRYALGEYSRDMARSHHEYGDLVARRFERVNMDGASSGDLDDPTGAIISNVCFDSTFARKPGKEMVAIMFDHGTPKVIGYRVERSGAFCPMTAPLHQIPD
jgi:hypothetical protein